MRWRTVRNLNEVQRVVTNYLSARLRSVGGPRLVLDRSLFGHMTALIPTPFMRGYVPDPKGHLIAIDQYPSSLSDDLFKYVRDGLPNFAGLQIELRRGHSCGQCMGGRFCSNAVEVTMYLGRRKVVLRYSGHNYEAVIAAALRCAKDRF